MTTLEQLQDQMILEVQRLSALELEGTLTHDEWEASLHEFEKRIDELPIPDQSGIDTEMFYPIEPE